MCVRVLAWHRTPNRHLRRTYLHRVSSYPWMNLLNVFIRFIGGIQVKHASYHVNHMWLITRMHKILPHCTLFYRVGHYNGFQKGFSFVSRLLFILLYLKLTLNWFIKVLQDFNQSSLSQRILLLVCYCCFAFTYLKLLLDNAFPSWYAYTGFLSLYRLYL